MQVRALREQVRRRSHMPRLRMVRVLSGRSLFTITTSRSSRYDPALTALYMTALHPTFGVEGYRSSSWATVPFVFPKCIADRLPILTAGDGCDAVKGHAPLLTAFVQKIYDAMHDEPHTDPAFVKFVNDVGLREERTRTFFGDLPAVFDAVAHGFMNVVPHVSPGDCIVLTGPCRIAKTDATVRNPLCTAHVDHIPATCIDSASRTYWRYHCQHAHLDINDHDGRAGAGAWAGFVHGVRSRTEHFGMPAAYLQTLDGTRHGWTPRTDGHVHAGRTQLASGSVRRGGYRVFGSSSPDPAHTSASRSLQDLSLFIHNTGANQHSFDITSRIDTDACFRAGVRKTFLNSITGMPTVLATGTTPHGSTGTTAHGATGAMGTTAHGQRVNAPARRANRPACRANAPVVRLGTAGVPEPPSATSTDPCFATAPEPSRGSGVGMVLTERIYFRNALLVKRDPTNPMGPHIFSVGSRSGAMKNQPMFSSRSGHGRGGAYVAQPEHINFQCREDVLEESALWYSKFCPGGTRLWVVPEQFRLWTAGTSKTQRRQVSMSAAQYVPIILRNYLMALSNIQMVDDFFVG
jgi:hypothetical protein